MKHLYFLFTIAYIACIAAAADSQPPMTEPEYVKEYLESLKEAGFNKDIMPQGNGGYGSPVNVRCTMYIIDVHKVDDYGMDYAVEFYFRQNWNDSRLSYYDKDISEIILNDADKIWVPDVFFVQEKEGSHHDLITPNTFIRIQPSGEVLYSVRLTVTFSCPMDFSKYPHDIQRCNFSAESYGRTADKLELEWAQVFYDTVSYDKNIKMHDFQLTDVKESSYRETFNSKEYAILRVTFTFERLTGFYVRRLYIPLILLAMISWTSFWIPSKMVALRLSLLLVVLYLMVTITTQLSCFFPPTSYIKGSDIWIAVCESLVFAAFLQFIAVHIIARNTEKLRKKMCKGDPETQILDIDAKTHNGNSVSSNSAISAIACRLKNDDQLAKRIDRMCAILFPIFFVIFNFVYFLVYCTGN